MQQNFFLKNKVYFHKYLFYMNCFFLSKITDKPWTLYGVIIGLSTLLFSGFIFIIIKFVKYFHLKIQQRRENNPKEPSAINLRQLQDNLTATSQL